MSEKPVTWSLKQCPCIATTQFAHGAVVPLDSEAVRRVKSSLFTQYSLTPFSAVLKNSPPGGRKPPTLCRYASHLILNNEECWPGQEKVDRLVLVRKRSNRLEAVLLII